MISKMPILVFAVLLMSVQQAQAAYQYSDLKTHLLDKSIVNMDALLEKIPTQYRKYFTLVKKNNSLQSGTAKRPRALYFGETAHLILAHNSPESVEGSEALELAEFNTLKNRIYLREVVLRGDYPPTETWSKEAVGLRQALVNPKTGASEIEYFDDHVLISVPNPVKCLACHADNPKTIASLIDSAPEDRLVRYAWPGYPDWPDTLGDRDLLPFFMKGYQELLDFKKESPSLPRYRHLQFAPYPKSPYHDDGATPPAAAYLPNTNFTNYMSILYTKQLAHLVYASSHFQKNKIEVLRRLAECGISGGSDPRVGATLVSMGLPFGYLSLRPLFDGTPEPGGFYDHGGRLIYGRQGLEGYLGTQLFLVETETQKDPRFATLRAEGEAFVDSTGSASFYRHTSKETLDFLRSNLIFNGGQFSLGELDRYCKVLAGLP